MRNVTIGQFVPGDSAWHRADPRVKLFLSLAAMIAAFSMHTPLPLLALFLLCMAGAAAARLPLGWYLGGLRTIWLLIGITFVFNALLIRTGPVLYAAGPLQVHADGLRLALLTSARLMLMVLIASLFTLTTSPIRITDGIERILSPLRRLGVPTTDIAMMMSIALRFIPTLMESAERIMKAQIARGASFGGRGPLARARALIPILVPLFVTSFRAADDLATAMEARCYHGGERTRMVPLRLTMLDVRCVLLAGLGLSAAVATEALQWSRWPF
jgi:energy-coupling factor transport system permease protein